MKTILVLASVLLLALSASAKLICTDLRCDYAVNPLGVDSSNPRLFWTVESRERGQKQTACQILVASSPAISRRTGRSVGQRQGRVG